MKTLTKMFLLSCWCLLSVSFAKEHIDQIKANQEQQIIQQKLEILEQENSQAKKEKISIPHSLQPLLSNKEGGSPSKARST